MKNTEIAIAMNEIEARNTATATMKKEEEKKMEKTVEVSATRKALIAAARKEAKALDTIRTNMEKATWKKALDATEALNNALSALNDDMLSEVYENALATSCPVASLCKAMTYPKWYAKTNKKDNVTTLESRSTRLNLLDFLKYAADSDTHDELKGAEKIKTALCDSARKVSDYVLSTLTNEGNVSIQTPKKALNALFALLGVEGVVARSVDMRYIVYATTKARNLGELQEITDRTMVPYIMDVMYVQLRGIEYKFEEKAENEKA